MDKFKEIIDNWYEKEGDNINTYTRESYLMELFEDLKANDFMKKDLPEAGKYIVSMLNQEFIDEGLTLTYRLIIENEVRLAFNAIYKGVKEVKEKKLVIEDKVEDGDFYEPTDEIGYIDPEEVEYVKKKKDEDFIAIMQGKLNG